MEKVIRLLLAFSVLCFLLYSGLLPRMVGELLTIWLANILTHVINNALLPIEGDQAKVPICLSIVCLNKFKVLHKFLLVYVLMITHYMFPCIKLKNHNIFLC
jgi:hypothetical protein